MSAPAHSVVQSYLASELPLILRIPLKQSQLTIGEVAGLGLGISIEITQQRIRIREVCISSTEGRGGRYSEAVTGAGPEIQSAGPLSTARRFTVQQTLIIGAELKVVATMKERNVIRERWFDVVVTSFTPSIQPVNVRGIAGRAAPTRNRRHQVELIVLWIDLGGCEVQSGSGKALKDASRRDESFRVVAHAKIKFIDDFRTKYVDPIRRPAIVFVKIV